MRDNCGYCRGTGSSQQYWKEAKPQKPSTHTANPAAKLEPPTIRSLLLRIKHTILHLQPYYHYPPHNKHSLIVFANSLFTYLWNVQANNNEQNKNNEELFFIRWNIQYIWRKWEINTPDQSADPETQSEIILPGHVQEIIDTMPAEIPADSINETLVQLAALMASPIVIYISGTNPEEKEDEQGDEFNANEQMPDLLTTQSSASQTAQDFDLIPTKLLLLLFYALQSISKLPLTTPLSAAHLDVLNSVSSCFFILNGPRRTLNTFVAVLAAWSLDLTRNVVALGDISGRLGDDLVNDKCPDATKTSLQIINFLLNTLVSCRISIPSVPTTTTKDPAINMIQFISTLEENLIPVLTTRLLDFTSLPPHCTPSFTIYHDILSLCLSIIESLTLLCKRHGQQLPEEPFLYDFIYAVDNGYRYMNTIHRVGHPMCVIVGRRMGRFLGLLKKCVNDEVVDDDEELVLLSDDEEVGKSSCTRIDYTRLLKIIDECLEYTQGFVGWSSHSTTEFDNCQCDDQLVDVSSKKRYCHKCKPVQTPLTPKDFIYGQFVRTSPDGRQTKHDCTDLKELNTWLKEKKHVQIGDEAEIVSAKRKTSVHQAHQAEDGKKVEYKDAVQREVLEGFDLEGLERETMRIAAWTFADVRVTYKN